MWKISPVNPVKSLFGIWWQEIGRLFIVFCLMDLFNILLVACVACLSATNTTWSCFINEGRSRATRLANTLAYTFTSTFSRAIGLKFCALSGSFPGLYSVITVACSILEGNEAEEAAVCKILCSIKSQRNFYNTLRCIHQVLEIY